MDPKLFSTVFVTVLLAEIGDKTQLATLLYSAENRSARTTVFAASAAALVLAAGIGVVAGDLISRAVSPRTLRWIAGLGFLAVGIWTLGKD
jgi:putative Ca2+/H+ antiporter (TMEM165/GDT1 family)